MKKVSYYHLNFQNLLISTFLMCLCTPQSAYTELRSQILVLQSCQSFYGLMTQIVSTDHTFRNMFYSSLFAPSLHIMLVLYVSTINKGDTQPNKGRSLHQDHSDRTLYILHNIHRLVFYIHSQYILYTLTKIYYKNRFLL